MMEADGPSRAAPVLSALRQDTEMRATHSQVRMQADLHCWKQCATDGWYKSWLGQSTPGWHCEVIKAELLVLLEQLMEGHAASWAGLRTYDHPEAVAASNTQER